MCVKLLYVYQLFYLTSTDVCINVIIISPCSPKFPRGFLVERSPTKQILGRLWTDAGHHCFADDDPAKRGLRLDRWSAILRCRSSRHRWPGACLTGPNDATVRLGQYMPPSVSTNRKKKTTLGWVVDRWRGTPRWAAGRFDPPRLLC
jgi:hypothetical protein